ncbi:MAG: hypothetical protein ACE1ZK_05390, partial [Nitrospirales bacterium]
VLRVRSARQAYSAEVSYEGREGLRPCLWKGASWRAWVGWVRQGTFLNIPPPTDASRLTSSIYGAWT